MRYYTRVSAVRRLQATDRIAELMTLPAGQAKPFRNRLDGTTSLLPDEAVRPWECTADARNVCYQMHAVAAKEDRLQNRLPAVAVGGSGPAG